MLIESLELRKLMSVSIHQLPGGGVLVQGTNGNDAVQIGQSGTQLAVQNGTYDANTNTFTPIEGDVYVADHPVNYVVVDLGNGDDFVQFGGENSTAVILTGNGNDHAEVSAFGTQNVALDTGNKDDTVFIDAHDNSNVVALAGNGDDTANIIVTENAHVIYSAGNGKDETTIANNGMNSQLIYSSGNGADVTNVFVGGYIGG